MFMYMSIVLGSKRINKYRCILKLWYTSSKLVYQVIISW